jgi:serine/threonine-protein kinase HipA
MAKLLWGKVFFNDVFAGYLRQEPGEGSSFTYDESYLSGNNRPISYTLPLQSQPALFQAGLPPFFDNLVAEGWMEQAQTRLLGKRMVSRFELLLAFGQDCAGAVSVIDPNPEKLTDALLDVDDHKELAILTSRASLSGIQPKLAIVEKQGLYYPAKGQQLSTHIAKFPSDNHIDLVANEYLSMLAFKILLPEETLAEIKLGNVQGFDEEVLIIKRFDRKDGKRIHFEEFNQLLDQPSNCKYMGSYKRMADFMRATPESIPADIYHLYLRILAGILLGNTDMHLKNFAMLYSANGIRNK